MKLNYRLRSVCGIVIIGIGTTVFLCTYLLLNMESLIPKMVDRLDSIETATAVARIRNFTIHKDMFKFNPNPTLRVPSHCEMNIVIILCEDNWSSKQKHSNNIRKSDSHSGSGKGSQSSSNDFSRQINQTLVLLKSLLITSKYSRSSTGDVDVDSSSCVRVIIVSDTRDHYEEILKRIWEEDKWDPEFTKYIKFSHVPVHYPPGN